MVKFSPAYAPDDTEFQVKGGDFSSLEIRDSGNGSGFHYFFDTQNNRLITDFILDDRPQVATLCQVTLIKKDGEYSPRIRLWKRDKTKPGRRPIEYEVAENEITKIVKATVDTGDTSDARRNFWTVVNYLQSLSQVSLPGESFRVVGSDSAELAKMFVDISKATVLEAVKIAIGSELTEEDVRIMSNRKARLVEFKKMLEDQEFFESEQQRLGKTRPEDVWQNFFESNSWIFGYGLHLVACEPLDDRKLEQITTGANIFTGAGKRSDAVLRSRGYISSLTFCEIKRHDTPLLAPKPYRPPDVYQVSKEVSGGVSQIQKTVSKALLLISSHLFKMYEDDGTPTDIQISAIRPRQVLVIGRLDEFSTNGDINRERLSTFELYRSSMQDIEIITFDELYERASFIVRD